MDTRKDYVAPAIAAEDTLEQTSLACTATTLLDTVNFVTGVCEVNIAKNGAYYDGITACTWYQVGEQEPVVLS